MGHDTGYEWGMETPFRIFVRGWPCDLNRWTVKEMLRLVMNFEKGAVNNVDVRGSYAFVSFHTAFQRDTAILAFADHAYFVVEQKRCIV